MAAWCLTNQDNPATNNRNGRATPYKSRQIRYDDVHEIIHCQPEGRAAIEGAAEWRA